MNNYFRLTKVLLKNGMNFSESGSKKKSRRLNGIILAFILMIGFGPMSVMIYFGTDYLYHLLAQFNQTGTIIALGLSGVSVLIFFFALFLAPGVYYYSKDIESLLPLPLNPEEIIFAKFTITLFYEYIAELIMLGPILLSFGINLGGSPEYWILAVIVFLTVPIAPLIYASIINMVTMRFTNIGKNKNIYNMLGGVFALFFGLGVNIAIQRLVTVNQTKLLEMLAQGNDSLKSVIYTIFPGNRFAVNALTGGTAIDFIFYLLISAAMLAVFLLIAKAIYFKGVIGITEAGTSRRAIGEAAMAQITREKGILLTYTFKEIKILLRTPIYFLNCVITNFLWPIFLVLTVFAGKEEDSMRDALKVLKYDDPQTIAITLCVAAAVGVFVASFNCVTSTAISREGTNFQCMKYIPVSYRTQIDAKVLSGIILSALGALCIYITAIFALGIPVWLLALSLPYCAFGIIISSYSGIMIDLLRPVLVWDNEQKPVKQNMNVVIMMGVAAFMGAVLIMGAVNLRTYALPLGIGALIALAAASYAVYRLSGYTAVKAMRRLS